MAAKELSGESGGASFTRRGEVALVGGLVTAGRSGMAAAPVFPATSWQSRSPQQLELDPETLHRFRLATGDDRGMIVRHGYAAYQWGDVSARFDWASAAKPVVSTMLLFALAEGRIPSVNARLSRFGRPMSLKDRTMTLRHLASMTSGYALPEAPGTHWGYNDYAI